MLFEKQHLKDFTQQQFRNLTESVWFCSLFLKLCSSLPSSEPFFTHLLFQLFKLETLDLLKGFKLLTHEKYLF